MKRTGNDCCVAQRGWCPPPLEDLERAAHLFRALADKTRLAILTQLREQGETCACDLVPGCCVGQPTVSHHLKVLRRASLVRAEKRGTWVIYSLNPDKMAELHRLLP